MDDLTTALAYEIKQEIATRYFGFRRSTEEKIQDYLLELDLVKSGILVALSHELDQIVFLLHDPLLIGQFLDYTGLQIVTPAEQEKDTTIQDIKARNVSGWSRKGKFQNLFFNIYKSLFKTSEEYRQRYLALEQYQNEISTEIETFFRNNDLSGILNFLRELDNPDTSNENVLDVKGSFSSARKMDKDLKIPPPPKVQSALPPLQKLPETTEAKKNLSSLLDSSYRLAKTSTRLHAII